MYKPAPHLLFGVFAALVAGFSITVTGLHAQQTQPAPTAESAPVLDSIDTPTPTNPAAPAPIGTEINPVESQAESLTSTQLSLTAIPTRLGDDMSLSLDPGSQEQVQLRVINTGDEPVRIRSTAHDFVVFDDAQTPTPITAEDADNRWSLASWLTIAPAVQTVQPGEMVSLNVVIAVPEDALPGGHYAMVTHQPDLSGAEILGNMPENTQASAINQRVGTLLYVKVNGFINENAVIREFTIPGFSEFGPVPFTFTVENLSDIHIQPRVTVEISNIFGQRVETIQLDQRNIFPFTAADFEGEWTRIWGFGRYNARVIMSYGESGVVEMVESFWLLPVTLIIAIVVVILSLIASWIAIRRHMIHRRQDSEKRIKELEGKLEKLQGNKLEEFED